MVLVAIRHHPFTSYFLTTLVYQLPIILLKEWFGELLGGFAM